MKRNDKEPVAVVYFKHNTAQRRMIDHNIWERLQQASPVYDGDRIRTAADSEAYTVFYDGTRLDLHENTLIQVFRRKNTDQVKFIDGAISVTTLESSSDFSVSAGDRSVRFSNKTNAVLASGSQGKIHTSVLSGAVRLTEKDVVPEKKHTVFSFVSSTDMFSRFIEKGMPSSEKNEDNVSVKDTIVGMSVPEQIVAEGNTAEYMPVPPELVSSQSGGKAVVAEIHETASQPVMMPPPDLSGLSGAVQRAFGTEKTAALIENITESVALQKSSFLVNDNNTTGATSKDSQAPVPDIAPSSGVVLPPPEIPVAESPIQAVPALPDVSVKHTPPVTKKKVVRKPEKKLQPPSFISVAPLLKAPADGALFTDQDFGGEHASIAFGWGTVAEAQEYQFSLYEGKPVGKPILSKTVHGMSYVLTGNELSLLDTGSFSWSVTAAGAKSGKKYRSKTAAASFTVSIAAIDNVIIDTSGLLNAN